MRQKQNPETRRSRMKKVAVLPSVEEGRIQRGFRSVFPLEQEHEVHGG